MRHLVIGQRIVDRLGAHPAQTDMRAGHHRQRPREAPAVAMEHRQGPQIHRMARHVGGENVAVAHQCRAAMVEHHALRIAGGAAGVIERDRIPFVVRHAPFELRIAAGDEVLVFDVAQHFARLRKFQIVVIDHQRLRFREPQRLLDDAGEFAIGDQQFRFAVIEDERQRRRIEPRVERVDHAAGHRNAVMRFQHGRRVGEHHRNRVAAADALFRQRGRQPPRALIELRISVRRAAMHDGGALRKHAGGAFEKSERRQRLVIRRMAVEIGVVRAARDGWLQALHEPHRRFASAAEERLAPSRARLRPGCGFSPRRARFCGV